MRRPVLITAVIAASLLLAACGDDTEPEAQTTEAPVDTVGEELPLQQEATAEDVAALAAVTVTGPLGGTPALDFEMPFATSAPVARVDTEGTGDVISNGQTVEIHYAMVDGDTGAQVGSTWDTGATESLLIGDPTLLGAINDVLVDQRVGVRVLAALPGMAATEVSAAAPSTLMVIEVLGAREVPLRAEGTPVEPPAGLPQISLLENGEPVLESVEGAVEPTELVTQTLIEGDGPAVESGQTLTVQYAGWLWDGTQFDASWMRGTPFQTPIGMGAVIQGWDEGLIGKTVGSQVLLVIPSELGYGETGSGSTIPPNATLIFVVDILEAR